MFDNLLVVRSDTRFDILTLDDKRPVSITADLTNLYTATIAKLLKDQTPIGAFRLPTSTISSSSRLLPSEEFLLCFDERAVYVTKRGVISRSTVIEYCCKARRAAIYGQYILLFHEDFVEIRDAQNGLLRQVIGGIDLKCLNDVQGQNEKVKVSLQHPYDERIQLVVELVLSNSS